MENEEQELDQFLELHATVQQDLLETGFSSIVTEVQKEPIISGHINGKSARELKNLYDDFLSYYTYLTGRVVDMTNGVTCAKVRLDHIKAEAFLRVIEAGGAKSADVREALVEVDPSYISAKKEHAYFKCMLNSQLERRDSIKRNMERIGRELWLRVQDDDLKDQGSPTIPSDGVSSGEVRLPAGYKRKHG